MLCLQCIIKEHIFAQQITFAEFCAVLLSKKHFMSFFAFGKGLCKFVVFNHWYLDEMTWHLSSGNFNREERETFIFV